MSSAQEAPDPRLSSFEQMRVALLRDESSLDLLLFECKNRKIWCCVPPAPVLAGSVGWGCPSGDFPGAAHG